MSGAPVHPAAEAFERHRAAVRVRLQQSGLQRPGPGSISWEINREMIAVAGWGRAILMQLAHPSVAAGVHDHTTFRGSLRASFRRFHSTVGAMLAITFGDREEMIAAAAGINTIHDRVRGRVRSDAGETYSAHDPDLQRWVQATLVESIPLTYELLVRRLTPAERDRYCAESALMEPLLGMPAGWLPRAATDLDSYINTMLASGQLRVTETSRALAQAVLYPPHWRLMWPAFRPLQLLAIGTLPSSLRDAYGFAWRDRDQRALKRWVAVLRASVAVLPRFARRWPVSSTAGEAAIGEPRTQMR